MANSCDLQIRRFGGFSGEKWLSENRLPIKFKGMEVGMPVNLEKTTL